MKNKAWLAALLFLIVACASSPPSNPADGVLEPVDDKAALSQEAMNPAYLELAQRLKSLGYEPVGIQYEGNALIDLLNQIFSDTRTHNRMITFVYTGLQMSYDKTAGTLTIGGMTNVPAIVAYIQKNVPLRPKDQFRPSVPPSTVPVTPKDTTKPLLPNFRLPPRPSPTPTPPTFTPPRPRRPEPGAPKQETLPPPNLELPDAPATPPPPPSQEEPTAPEMESSPPVNPPVDLMPDAG